MLKREERDICRQIKKGRHVAENRQRQIDGILNMIEEDRYCIDISHQLMATMDDSQ